jgi:hypothetical protein
MGNKGEQIKNIGWFFLLSLIVILYVNVGWNFHNNIWWLLLPITTFILYNLFQIHNGSTYINGLIDGDMGASIGSTIGRFMLIYGNNKSLCIISALALFILLLYYSFYYKHYVLFAMLFLSGLTAGFKFLNKADIAKKYAALIITSGVITSEELFYSIIILIVSCSIIKYYGHLENTYLAVYVLSAISTYMIFLYNKRYFYSLIALVFVVMLIMRIFKYNYGSMLLDIVYIIVLIITILFSNTIVTRLFKMNGAYEDTRTFKEQIKRFKYFLWILSSLCIIALLENTYQSIAIDADTQLLIDSIVKQNK